MNKIRKGSFSSDFNHKRFKFQYLFRNTFFLFYFFFKSSGPTTGAVFLTLDEARVDLKPVDVVRKCQHVSFKVPDKVRPSDKLYKLVSHEDLKKK